jgi:hypothetical protein
VHRALVRNIIAGSGVPDIDCSLLLAESPTNRNAVHNVEYFEGDLDGNHYWKHAFRAIQTFSDSRPYANPHIDLGYPVWLALWDEGIEEPHFHLAITRNEPLGIQQTLDMFYITDDGTRQNIDDVPAALTLSHPATESFWTLRRVIRELPE